MGVTAILASLLVPVSPATVVVEEEVAEIITAECVKRACIALAF